MVCLFVPHGSKPLALPGLQDCSSTGFHVKWVTLQRSTFLHLHWILCSLSGSWSFEDWQLQLIFCKIWNIWRWSLCCSDRICNKEKMNLHNWPSHVYFYMQWTLFSIVIQNDSTKSIEKSPLKSLGSRDRSNGCSEKTIANGSSNKVFVFFSFSTLSLSINIEMHWLQDLLRDKVSVFKVTWAMITKCLKLLENLLVFNL